MGKEVQFIQGNIKGRRLRLASDDQFLYQVSKDKHDQGEIKMISIHYVSYQMTSVYVESNPSEYIRSMSYDPIQKKVALLVRTG